MIDTLHLTLTDLEISSGNLTIEEPKWNLRTNEKEASFDLFVDKKTGEVIRAKKAYLNSDKFNITIFPNHFSLISPDLKSICKLSLSVPRYAKGKNTDPVSVDEFKEVLKHLEYTLRENGIFTNIDNSEVSRVDLFKMIKTKYEFNDYLPVLSLLEFQRIKNHRDYGTTLLNHNSQRQYAIYDKVEEENIKSKIAKIINHDYNKKHDKTRFEYRLLKSKSVKSQIGFSKTKDFHENYSEVQKPFYDYSLSMFGKEPENIVKPIIEDVRQGLIKYRDKGFQHPIEKYLSNEIAIPSLIKQIGLEDFIQIIKEEFNKQRAYEWKKRIKAVLKNQTLSLIDPSTKETYVSLYREIKTKLLMRVA